MHFDHLLESIKRGFSLESRVIKCMAEIKGFLEPFRIFEKVLSLEN